MAPLGRAPLLGVFLESGCCSQENRSNLSPESFTLFVPPLKLRVASSPTKKCASLRDFLESGRCSQENRSNLRPESFTVLVPPPGFEPELWP